MFGVFILKEEHAILLNFESDLKLSHSFSQL